jgi:ribosome-binding protein aMBF1 (putative translation factor)
MHKIDRKKYVSFDEVHAQDMKDPEYRKAYEALQPRYALISELIRLRNEKKMTQSELAKRLGMHQSAIARFETGVLNPSFDFVSRLTNALGMKLKIVR